LGIVALIVRLETIVRALHERLNLLRRRQMTGRNISGPVVEARIRHCVPRQITLKSVQLTTVISYQWLDCVNAVMFWCIATRMTTRYVNAVSSQENYHQS
jgi:hypothetical protein